MGYYNLIEIIFFKGGMIYAMASVYTESIQKHQSDIPDAATGCLQFDSGFHPGQEYKENHHFRQQCNESL